jgi:hypothetical protein
MDGMALAWCCFSAGKAPREEDTMSKHRPSPNDQRSNALNPNNAAHKASQDNRSRQLNPKEDANPTAPASVPDQAPTPDTNKSR